MSVFSPILPGSNLFALSHPLAFLIFLLFSHSAWFSPGRKSAHVISIMSSWKRGSLVNKAMCTDPVSSSGVSPFLFAPVVGNRQCSLWAAYQIWNMCLHCEWIWGQELCLRCCLHARLACTPEFNTFLSLSIFRYIWDAKYVLMSLTVIVVMNKASILWVTSESVVTSTAMWQDRLINPSD